MKCLSRWHMAVDGVRNGTAAPATSTRCINVDCGCVCTAHPRYRPTLTVAAMAATVYRFPRLGVTLTTAVPSSSSSILSASAPLPHALTSATIASPSGALHSSQRSFYSGLDESRVQRLRRSGMTFNRPRGRDNFSIAFESRLRIRPLLRMSDLYGPIDASRISAADERDPTSSRGNPLEKRKSDAGDARMQRVMEQKQQAEAILREKRDWRVLVVDPIELDMVEAPVAYPSPHYLYYADWAAARVRGPPTSRVLEQRLIPTFDGAVVTTLDAETSRLPSSCSSSRDAVLSPTESAVFDSTTTTITTTTASSSNHTGCSGSTSAFESLAFFYAAHNRRHLQQNGDTTRLSGSFVHSTTLSIPPSPSSTSSSPVPHTVHQHFYSAVCVDPNIRHQRYRREEAQVEMISAYRNILYEAAELPSSAPASPLSDIPLSQTTPLTSSKMATSVADVVRVPALCSSSCGSRFGHELGKLNQQAAIKGFHRLSNEVKEALIINPAFAVEIWVPPMLLEQFEAAFLEEAWEAPTSTLNPGRTALYPGLAPPRTLLQYDGWVGKRPELIEGVETEGRSLLRGESMGLDGKPIEDMEVWTSLRVFGAREAQLKMLEEEHKTVAEQLRVPLETSHAALHAGLLMAEDDVAVAPTASPTVPLPTGSGDRYGETSAAATSLQNAN